MFRSTTIEILMPSKSLQATRKTAHNIISHYSNRYQLLISMSQKGHFYVANDAVIYEILLSYIRSIFPVIIFKVVIMFLAVIKDIPRADRLLMSYYGEETAKTYVFKKYAKSVGNKFG